MPECKTVLLTNIIFKFSFFSPCKIGLRNCLKSIGLDFESQKICISHKNPKANLKSSDHLFCTGNFKLSQLYIHTSKMPKYNKMRRKRFNEWETIDKAFNTSAWCPSASGRHEASSNMCWFSKMNGISYSIISGSQSQESNFLLQIKKPLMLFHLKILQLHYGILCPFIWPAGPLAGQLWGYVPTPKQIKI